MLKISRGGGTSPLLFLDATLNYSDPASTNLKYLRADNQWAKPTDDAEFYAADGEWRVPELLPSAGDLSIDAKVLFLSMWGEPIVWRVIGHDLPGMPADSVTLLSDKILALMPFDAIESSNPTEDRRLYGNNDYTVSNIRQWLNSDKGEGLWYSPQHQHDQPPDKYHVASGFNAYSAWAGFLYSANADDKSALLETERSIGGETVGNGKNCIDSVFLLTADEYGVRSYEGDGSMIQYFYGDAFTRIAYPTVQCVQHNEYTNPNLSADSAWWQWTASSYSHSGTLPSVDKYGQFGYDEDRRFAAFGNTGVRPACNVSKNTRFTLANE